MMSVVENQVLQGRATVPGMGSAWLGKKREMWGWTETLYSVEHVQVSTSGGYCTVAVVI